MRVLIVDAPEVMQRSLVDALTAAGHDVRLLTPKDGRPPMPIPGAAPVSHADTTGAGIESAAAGVDAAICFSSQPAAACAGIPRVVEVTPLRASHQHPQPPPSSASKPIVVATTTVYGPGDDLVSRLLIMMRSLPVVPLLANGERQYQPIWHEDLAAALVRAVDSAIPDGSTFRVSGPDVVTQQTLYESIAELTGRRPVRVPIPEFVTKIGSTVIDALSAARAESIEAGWAVDAEGVLLSAEENDLLRTFHVAPTPIGAGLRRLINEQPEQLPSQGVGTLEVKRFWSDIRGTHHDPASLLRMFRARFAEIMPIPVGVEQASPNGVLAAGATVTMELPGRGHVQVRVEEADDREVVVATLRGHPLAGFVRFRTAPAEHGVRFEITTGDRSANPLDWLTLTLGGSRGQNANWRTVLQNVARLAGGVAGDVEMDTRDVKGEEADEIDRWVRGLIEHRTRAAGTGR